MDLNFPLPPSVTLATGPNGLPRLEIATPLAEAHLYLHGAHVTHYRAHGQEPLLFLSARSRFEAGRPIRGGVPLVFPWFGAKAGDAAAPAHGVARIRPWALESAQESEDEVVLTLRLEADADSHNDTPAEWTLRHRVRIGSRLTMELEVENHGATPFTCEEAWHTYFHVADVREVALRGLQGVAYSTAIEEPHHAQQQEEPLRFSRETDRVYHHTSGPYQIEDPGLKRRICIEKSGAPSAIVWNPWVAKARAMEDFGDDEWPHMLCVETGSVGPDRLEIAPGAAHHARTQLWAEAL